jgi:hypothetical protein
MKEIILIRKADNAHQCYITVETSGNELLSLADNEAIRGTLFASLETTDADLFLKLIEHEADHQGCLFNQAPLSICNTFSFFIKELHFNGEIYYLSAYRKLLQDAETSIEKAHRAFTHTTKLNHNVNKQLSFNFSNDTGEPVHAGGYHSNRPLGAGAGCSKSRRNYPADLGWRAGETVLECTVADPKYRKCIVTRIKGYRYWLKDSDGIVYDSAYKYLMAHADYETRCKAPGAWFAFNGKSLDSYYKNKSIL